MNRIELSLEKLNEVSVCAAQKIAEKKPINLVVYIARAGFPVAFYMNAVFQCRLLGINAARRGNRLKSVLGKILACTPELFRNMLRSVELKSNLHKRHPGRHIEFHASLQELDPSLQYSILVVDDSVDTGNSMKQAVTKVAEQFPNATITTYAVNVFEASKALITVDYFTFRDSALRTPMSKDSKEYKMFCAMYRRETLNGYI